MGKDLFRIEGFVEDKNLPKVKRLLMGLVLDFKDQPVVNAKHRNGKVSAETNGNVSNMLLEYCKKHKMTDLNVSDVRQFAASIGRRDEGASYILKKAMEDGVLRKLGKGTKSHYRVVLK